jgi:hypothetical protein
MAVAATPRHIAAMTHRLLALLAAIAAHVDAEQLCLNVNLHNLANAPEPVVRRAADVTSKVLAAAGVRLEWRYFRESIAPDQASPSQGCRVAPDLFVWLLPKDMATHVDRSPSTAAVALQPNADPSRNGATMFYDRIAESARTSQSSRSAVLGYLMAHEIGHLLLGVNAHQPYGVMRRAWKIGDFRAAERGELLFSEEQASKIRAEVARRVTAAKPVSSENP